MRVYELGYYACLQTTDGQGYCWGDDRWGQLGDPGASGNQQTPVPVDASALPAGASWASLISGQAETCGVATTGAGYCWGADDNGELGNGPATTGSQASPVLVDSSMLAAGATWHTIWPGSQYTCGVATDGTGYCWAGTSPVSSATGPVSPATSCFQPRWT